MRSIFNYRNLVIFVSLVVGMIIGAGLAAYKKEDQGNVIEDSVNVVVPGNPLLVSDQFRAGLRSLGAVGIALVDGKETLLAVTMDGVPIDLCGIAKDTEKSDRTCRLKISANELIAHLAGRARCPQRCPDGEGNPHACETRTNTYDCNDSSPTECESACD